MNYIPEDIEREIVQAVQINARAVCRSWRDILGHNFFYNHKNIRFIRDICDSSLTKTTLFTLKRMLRQVDNNRDCQPKGVWLIKTNVVFLGKPRRDFALDIYNLPTRIPCCAAFGRWKKRRCNRPSRPGCIMCHHHDSLANSVVWEDPNEKLIADPTFKYKSLL
jgi:hypothetical protein